jgi:hypothetical protein
MAAICPSGQLIDDALGQTTPWHGFPQLYLQQIPRASAFLSGTGFFPGGHLHGGHFTFAQGLCGGDSGEQLFFPPLGDLEGAQLREMRAGLDGGWVEQDSSGGEGEGGLQEGVAGCVGADVGDGVQAGVSAAVGDGVQAGVAAAVEDGVQGAVIEDDGAIVLV